MATELPSVLSMHNYYQLSGGEDQVYTAEANLLKSHGHEVSTYTISNDQIRDMRSIEVFAATLWNHKTYREIKSILRLKRPQIVHFHNFFPLISPSAYYAAQEEGAAVVQTLHNYRLVCPDALLFRDGRACEDCLRKKIPWPGVIHKCYRNSLPATTGVAGMITLHRALHTWNKQINIYIALTEFARQKFIAGGLPADRVVVKPNFVPAGFAAGEGSGGYAIFAGRIAEGKGLPTLVKAWKQIGSKLPIKIVGDGPLLPQLQTTSCQTAGLEWLGQQPREKVISLMQQAKLLIFPSEVYENFPVTIAEAFCAGLPVVVSGHGAMQEIVTHQRNGLHFQPGNSESLVEQVFWALDHPELLAEMRHQARAEFEAKYTAERNYQMLARIYDLALRRMSAGQGYNNFSLHNNNLSPKGKPGNR